MKHLVALVLVVGFLLFGGLAVYFGYELAAVRTLDDGAVWRCTELSCVAYLNVDEWVAEHCTTGAEQTCSIVINGQSQTLPLSSLNMTYLGSQCVTWLCTEEALVRPMNYMVAVNATAFSVQ